MHFWKQELLLLVGIFPIFHLDMNKTKKRSMIDWLNRNERKLSNCNFRFVLGLGLVYLTKNTYKAIKKGISERKLKSQEKNKKEKKAEGRIYE